MVNNESKLFKEALNFFDQKKYYQAKNILEVLVKNDYKPAISLMKSTIQKIKNEEAIDNFELDGIGDSATKDEKSVEHPKQYNRTTISTFHKKSTLTKKLILLDPSNKIWLNIMLYSFFVFEIILFVSSIIVSFLLENFLIFSASIIGIIMIHIIAMVSLNLSFNIQSIKDDISEIKYKK